MVQLHFWSLVAFPEWVVTKYSVRSQVSGLHMAQQYLAPLGSLIQISLSRGDKTDVHCYLGWSCWAHKKWLGPARSRSHRLLARELLTPKDVGGELPWRKLEVPGLHPLPSPSWWTGAAGAGAQPGEKQHCARPSQVPASSSWAWLRSLLARGRCGWEAKMDLLCSVKV